MRAGTSANPQRIRTLPHGIDLYSHSSLNQPIQPIESRLQRPSHGTGDDVPYLVGEWTFLLQVFGKLAALPQPVRSQYRIMKVVVLW